MSIMAKIKHWLRLDLKHSYISSADEFLAEFDKNHPEKSASQLDEIEKYRRVNELRDHPQKTKVKASDSLEIWDKF